MTVPSVWRESRRSLASIDAASLQPDPLEMRSLVASVTALFTVLFCSRRELLFEIAALRQQVAVLSASGRKPKLHPSDRVFWVVLSRLWARWESVLHIVKPATVIAWHKKGFRLLWTWKSRRGRPRIEREHRVLIRQLSRDNPSWGENRIADELRQKLGVDHAASTVRRYMHRPSNDPEQRRRSSQNWRTFLKNHGNEIYACDFVTQYTATFQVVYVFVVMQLGTRRVIHANATASPNLDWVKTQLRDICAFGAKPRFLIHDNDGIFGQFGRRRDGCRCNLDLCGGDPHALPRAERERGRRALQPAAATRGPRPLRLLL